MIPYLDNIYHHVFSSTIELSLRQSAWEKAITKIEKSVGWIAELLYQGIVKKNDGLIKTAEIVKWLLVCYKT